MKVRVLSWAIVLLAHGLALVWLAEGKQEPKASEDLPVLAVDMLSADESQAAEKAEPPAAPASRPEPAPAPVIAPSPPALKQKSPPLPKKPSKQTRKQEPLPPGVPSVAPPTGQAPIADAAPDAPASAVDNKRAGSSGQPRPTTQPEDGGAATHTPATSVYIPAEYAAGNRKPVYPTLSLRYGEEGTVVLRVLVGADGRADQVKIHTSSGHKLLDRSALQAVQDWRFAPATNNGQPVSDWFLVPIPFTLHD